MFPRPNRSSLEARQAGTAPGCRSSGHGSGSIRLRPDANPLPARSFGDHRSHHPGCCRDLDGNPPVSEPAEISVGASIKLEARWDVPGEAERGVVLCHPHPLHRGTMRVPLFEAITADLMQRSVAVLRFNFRGVGRSTGSHDGGLGEIDDVAAAVEFAEVSHPDLSFGVAGWSFGAGAALRWHARDRSEHNYVGIAPGAGGDPLQRLPEPESLQPARRTIIIGERDQLVSPQLISDYAHRAGATLHVLKGSDHFFYFREQKVACLVAAGLGLPVPAHEIELACQ